MNNEIKEILDFKENADYKKLSCDEIKVLKDYITNLQQDLANYVNVVLHDRKIIDDYKSRIEKAVEYINEHIRIDDEYPLYMEMKIEEKNELLNILNGRSDE